ncbi:MAG: hypothetical protein WBE68_25015, partial [Candidatus Nitrosopolaris sp.]
EYGRRLLQQEHKLYETDFLAPENSIKNSQDSNDQVQGNSVIRHDVRSKTLKRIFLMTTCQMNLQQRIIRHSTFSI